MRGATVVGNTLSRGIALYRAFDTVLERTVAIKLMHRNLAEHSEQLAFHGFDAPIEMTVAPSPGPYLRHLGDYVGVPVKSTDESEWSDPAAVMEATRRSASSVWSARCSGP